MSEKWEYKVVQNMALMGGDKKLLPELNALGQEGWKGISVSSQWDGHFERVHIKGLVS